MSWFAITTSSGKEEKLSRCIESLLPESTVFIPPTRKITIHGTEKNNTQIALVFVNAESEESILSIKPTIKLKEKLKFSVMYDIINQKVLVIPDYQMEIFKRYNPQHIDELIILSKPFAEYAEKNIRFYVEDGPFAGVEGYKIDLHREKKLAIAFGNITMALNTMYKYKVCRVIEPEKDPVFKSQQLHRIVCNIIGSLKVHGFVDDAYSTLIYILGKCHECNNDIGALFELFNEYSTNEIDRKIADYIDSLDAITAGHIISLANHLTQKDLLQPLPDEMKPKDMLPFLTPPYGKLDTKISHKYLQHEGFEEMVCKVQLTERTPLSESRKEGKAKGKISTLEKIDYFAHIKIEPEGKDKTILSCDFSAFFSVASSLERRQRETEIEKLRKNDSPLLDVLEDNNPEGITLTSKGLTIVINAARNKIDEKDIQEHAKILIKKGVAITENLLHTSRMAMWRNLLPTIIIHKHK